MPNTNLDTFICVHKRDVDYLFETVLKSYLLNYEPKGKLTIITNDLPYLEEFLASKDLNEGITLSRDEEWLSRREMNLGGWYRQQLIKLRSFEFCETDNFCNIGADTVLLNKIQTEDLVQNGLPVMYYTRHMPPEQHLIYEVYRVFYAGRTLNVTPKRAWRYIDFINDLFCFNRQELIDLNKYLQKLYGDDYFCKIIEPLGTKDSNKKKFGEWTLYSVFVLDYLKHQRVTRDTTRGFEHQIHSQRKLRTYKFDTKVAHFVGKDFDLNYIQGQMRAHQIELGNYLIEAKSHVSSYNA